MRSTKTSHLNNSMNKRNSVAFVMRMNQPCPFFYQFTLNIKVLLNNTMTAGKLFIKSIL